MSMSRWLTWIPSGPIMEKTTEHQLPGLPKPDSGSFGSPALGVSRKIETRDGLPGADPNLHRDRAYVAAFEAAMDEMRAATMPEGCLPWLAESDSRLYRLLTKALPDNLQEVWATPGDHLPAFQWVLDRIVDAHRKARQLYAERWNGPLPKPIPCAQCGVTLESAVELAKHLNAEHSR